jgi:hypothetical protein
MINLDISEITILATVSTSQVCTSTRDWQAIGADRTRRMPIPNGYCDQFISEDQKFIANRAEILRSEQDLDSGMRMRRTKHGYGDVPSQ